MIKLFNTGQKQLVFLTGIVLLSLMVSCGNKEETKPESDPGVGQKEIADAPELPGDKTLVDKKIAPDKLITEQIVYDVIIRADAEDEYTGTYEHIAPEMRENLISSILNAVKSGRLKAYKGLLGLPTNKEEDLLTTEEVEAALNIRDTIWTENVETKVPEPQAVEYSLDQELIRLTFVEEWYFDEEQLQMMKVVNGIALAHPVYNHDGTLRGHKPLFYVWLNDIDLIEEPV